VHAVFTPTIPDQGADELDPEDTVDSRSASPNGAPTSFTDLPCQFGDYELLEKIARAAWAWSHVRRCRGLAERLR